MTFIGKAKSKKDCRSCAMLLFVRKAHSVGARGGKRVSANHYSSIKCNITPAMIVMANSHGQQLYSSQKVHKEKQHCSL